MLNKFDDFGEGKSLLACAAGKDVVSCRFGFSCVGVCYKKEERKTVSFNDINVQRFVFELKKSFHLTIREIAEYFTLINTKRKEFSSTAITINSHILSRESFVTLLLAFHIFHESSQHPQGEEQIAFNYTKCVAIDH